MSQCLTGTNDLGQWSILLDQTLTLPGGGTPTESDPFLIPANTVVLPPAIDIIDGEEDDEFNWAFNSTRLQGFLKRVDTATRTYVIQFWNNQDERDVRVIVFGQTITP